MTTRRAFALLISFFALQIGACSGSPFEPDGPDTDARFLIGGSPLAPFWLAKSPVLEANRNAKGQVERQLVIEVILTLSQADALKSGNRAFQSSAGFWISGEAVALADPRPSPIVGLFDQKDGNTLVVIAMPIDDATWSQLGRVAQAGESVGVIMDIDLVDPTAAGGSGVIHSLVAGGSFTM